MTWNGPNDTASIALEAFRTRVPQLMYTDRLTELLNTERIHVNNPIRRLIQNLGVSAACQPTSVRAKSWAVASSRRGGALVSTAVVLGMVVSISP